MRSSATRIVGTVAALLLFVVFLGGFFALTPWLNCRPLSELPQMMRDPVIQEENPTIRENMAIPHGTTCFTVNHNRVQFVSHGLIAEEPARFALHVAAMLLPLVLLFLLLRSGPGDRKPL